MRVPVNNRRLFHVRFPDPDLGSPGLVTDGWLQIKAFGAAVGFQNMGPLNPWFPSDQVDDGPHLGNKTGRDLSDLCDIDDFFLALFLGCPPCDFDRHFFVVESSHTDHHLILPFCFISTLLPIELGFSSL